MLDVIFGLLPALGFMAFSGLVFYSSLIDQAFAPALFYLLLFAPAILPGLYGGLSLFAVVLGGDRLSLKTRTVVLGGLYCGTLVTSLYGSISLFTFLKAIMSTQSNSEEIWMSVMICLACLSINVVVIKHINLLRKWRRL